MKEIDSLSWDVAASCPCRVDWAGNLLSRSLKLDVFCWTLELRMLTRWFCRTGRIYWFLLFWVLADITCNVWYTELKDGPYPDSKARAQTHLLGKLQGLAYCTVDKSLARTKARKDISKMVALVPIMTNPRVFEFCQIVDFYDPSVCSKSAPNVHCWVLLLSHLSDQHPLQSVPNHSQLQDQEMNPTISGPGSWARNFRPPNFGTSLSFPTTRACRDPMSINHLPYAALWFRWINIRSCNATWHMETSREEEEWTTKNTTK